MIKSGQKKKGKTYVKSAQKGNYRSLYHYTTVHIHTLPACWLSLGVLALTSRQRHGSVGEDLEK